MSFLRMYVSLIADPRTLLSCTSSLPSGALRCVLAGAGAATVSVAPPREIGRHLRVFWPSEKEWFGGRLEKVRNGEFHIAYDDGAYHTHNIKDNWRWKYVPDRSARRPTT